MLQYLEWIAAGTFFLVHCVLGIYQIKTLQQISEKLEELQPTEAPKVDQNDIHANLHSRLLHIQQDNYARRYPFRRP